MSRFKRRLTPRDKWRERQRPRLLEDLHPKTVDWFNRLRRDGLLENVQSDMASLFAMHSTLMDQADVEDDAVLISSETNAEGVANDVEDLLAELALERAGD